MSTSVSKERELFKHYREVEHSDGAREIKWAPMQKTIYSLPALRELREAANRYLELLTTLTDPRAGRDQLDQLWRTIQPDDRSYPGSICSTPTTCCSGDRGR